MIKGGVVMASSLVAWHGGTLVQPGTESPGGEMECAC